MSSGIRISWRTSLKRLISEPSSHCGRWTLILFSVTLDSLMHRCVAHTKVMETVLLTYPHVLEYGCHHFVARRLAVLFRVAVASTPSSLSTEATKVENCRHFWRQSSKYIFFFASSASCRHFQVYLPNGTWNLCSLCACREHCQSHSARGHGSVVHPSVPWLLAVI